MSSDVKAVLSGPPKRAVLEQHLVGVLDHQQIRDGLVGAARLELAYRLSVWVLGFWGFWVLGVRTYDRLKETDDVLPGEWNAVGLVEDVLPESLEASFAQHHGHFHARAPEADRCSRQFITYSVRTATHRERNLMSPHNLISKG